VQTPQSIPDHDLMLAVRDGDLDCMGELFERHHGPLFGFLAKLTGNRATAEDICQVVFQRMLKYRHTYRDEGNFTAWMYHLARRCAADHFRRASTSAVTVDPSGLESHADTARSADEAAERSDDHALLRRALERFSLPYITITPTFSICPSHGYLPGEHPFCPKCDEDLLSRRRTSALGVN
jgi:RNA polymerase sigma factor (sigma-70 family)